MVLLFFSCILLIPVLAGWGKIAESFFGSLYAGISANALSGILVLSLIWTILAFFIPINIYTEVPVVLAGLFFFFRDKLYRHFSHFSKKDIALTAGISLIILYCSSFYPYILDHFGYYVPTIQWLTEYGLVKGISNLDLTLGQMSVWHIFQAGFSGFSDPFLRINAVLLILYIVYIFERKSWIQLCFLPILLLFSQSPSPDLPVITISLIMLNELLTGNKNPNLLFAFSVFVFTIKPTMIWLPMLTFLFTVFTLKTKFSSLIFGLSILLLFFIKNIWTFGYPVFPVALADPGAGWKPNPDILNISSQYAIQKTFDMQFSYEEIQKFTFGDHVKNWLTLKGIKSKINLLFIISLILFSAFAFFKKKRMISLICISLLIKSVLVLIFSAQYRFFIDVFFVIFFVVFFEYLNRKRSVFIFTAGSLVLILILTFPAFIRQYIPSFRPGSFMAGFQKEQLYKPSVYRYQKYTTFKAGNLKFNVSKNYPFNFDTPLPAISESYLSDDVHSGIFPQCIDEKDIKKGFIWKKLSPAEKKEAEKVIHTIKNTDKQN
ncbi:LIC_10190 family membrane protein [Chryseobacterium indologenes]|uniref:DUF8201 domain-containing protein n=1 Tax=Chryseobacterium indologenes TaxID=253 RepID=A0A0N0IX76_CHRID|nr:hypothetical protein [Chryseobacterium indologenes]KPE51984.1 hypothetical protein AOB46_07155 [Chryseobacterium indologenes]